MKRTRLKDIAEALGLSANTVSLALKGSARINEQTRLKVQQKAGELSYIPNALARSLVQKKTNTIGLLLPRMTNPIFLETAQRMETVLVRNGYTMILMTTDRNPTYESRALDMLLSREVDGILMYPVKLFNRDKIRAVRAAHCPIILLSNGEYAPPSDAVYMNQSLGAYKAATHLIRLGHREIAFISGGINNDADKHKGYNDALAHNGIRRDPELVVHAKEIGYEQGYQAASVLFSRRRPTAILASGDYLALGALRWCRNNGLRIPEEVALVGFDDLEAAQFAEVPLTSVAYHFEEMTNKATALLFSLLADKSGMSASAPQSIPIEPTLAIRESCGWRCANKGTHS